MQKHSEGHREGAARGGKRSNRNFFMLKLENITFTVHADGGEKTILRDVNLSLNPGRLAVITGPNGGGKSTLARIIAGIEKPTSGRILFDGEDITGKNITERARMGIGFAFQQPVRFKGIRVLDLLRLASGRPLTVPEACEYLASVGLCARDYVNREMNASLSGGELKRIEIATVFAKSSRLSVFDEPEAGIDLWSFQNLIDLFQDMRRNIRESSILIISHQERILNIADEIVVIRSGAVERQGARDEVLPHLSRAMLSVGGCCVHGLGRAKKC